MGQKTNLILTCAFLGFTTGLLADESKKTESNSEPKDIVGKCEGVNSCKGTSACHSKVNSCAGSNACKGQGWLKLSEKECKSQKGKFTKL